MAGVWQTATIPNGTAVTQDLAIAPNQRIIGVLVPATWTAADIGFEVSNDSVTFYPVIDPAGVAGTEDARIKNVATGAAQFYIVPDAIDESSEQTVHQKLRSINTASNADVNQGADRVLQVLLADRR